MFKLNFNSNENFVHSYGDIFALEEFLEMVKEGSIMGYDGFASEILNKDKKIIYNTFFSPEYALEHKNYLLEKQKKYGQLYIVWYNR